MGHSCRPRVEEKVCELWEKGRTDWRRIPPEFSFSCEPSRARARGQSSFWSGDCGREVERFHPTRWPEAGGSGRTSPGKEKPCPGSFPKRRQRCSPGGRRRAGARDTRHPPTPARLPLARAPRADRAAVCARRAPRWGEKKKEGVNVTE